MPAIDFPAAPAVNDEYSFEGRTWRWNGTGWEVKEYPAALLAGTAANPSLYFSGDPNTGLYSPGADQVAISTGGSERARIDSSGRLLVGTSTVPTFRIGNQDRTDSTHIITKSGTALGTSFAVVQWAGNTVGTWGNDVVFAKSYSGTVGTHTIGSINSVVGRLFFSASDGTRFTPAAAIETYIDGTPGDLDMPGRLVFSTTADGAASSTERMRIDSAGRVGIGVTPTNKLHLSAANNDLTSGFLQDGATTGYNAIQIKNTSGSALFGVNGSTVGTVATSATAYSTVAGSYNNTDFHLISNDVVRATVNTSGELLIGTTTRTANGGVLQVSNGITFPATQSACSDANTLDDYEEGTWTPTVFGTTIAGTATYSQQTGKYTKVGRLVTIEMRLSWSGGTGTGDLRVSGLPFTASAYTAIAVGSYSDLAFTANKQIGCYTNINATNIYLVQLAASTAVATVPYDAAADELMIAGSYTV